MNVERILIFTLISLSIITAVVGAMTILEYKEEMSKPYFESIFTNKPMSEWAVWNKTYITVMATGNPANYDIYCLQDVLNEWNTKMEWPKLGYNQTAPDIVISFDKFENDGWAGCAWTTTDKNGYIVKGFINIRTSWPFSREHVIRHELGHVMGLTYHSNHPNSTMYKYANGAPEWSNEDIEVLHTLYK